MDRTNVEERLVYLERAVEKITHGQNVFESLCQLLLTNNQLKAEIAQLKELLSHQILQTSREKNRADTLENNYDNLRHFMDNQSQGYDEIDG